MRGGAILSLRGRPFLRFSTTSAASNISGSGLRLHKARFLLMEAILSSLSLLVSSLALASFRTDAATSLGLNEPIETATLLRDAIVNHLQLYQQNMFEML